MKLDRCREFRVGVEIDDFGLHILQGSEMTSSLKPGMQLYARLSTVRLIVVRAAEGILTIDDEQFSNSECESAGNRAADGPQVHLGKRYYDGASSLEVLCTRPGRGVLAFDKRALELREAKALPSSD
jgi:hypothetical protein